MLAKLFGFYVDCSKTRKLRKLTCFFVLPAMRVAGSIVAAVFASYENVALPLLPHVS